MRLLVKTKAVVPDLPRLSISRLMLSCVREETYTGTAATRVAADTTPTKTLASSHRLFATRLRTSPQNVRECI